MSGWILSASDEVGMVRRVFVSDGKVSFSTRIRLSSGVHELHLWNGTNHRVRVLSTDAERISYDGPSWKVTAELVRTDEATRTGGVPA